ncbi:MAG: sigma-70 family RNA polymerase sigma factor [Candidatus Brocadiia bacterium]
MSEDLILLKRYAEKGDARAFAELVHRHAGLVYSTCLRITRRPADAEDATQETFLCLARGSSQVRESVAGWLFRVARRVSCEKVRSEKVRRQREEGALQDDTLTEGQSWAEIAPHVDEALSLMPDEIRSSVISYYLEGKNQAQIAAELGVTQSTVSRRLETGISEVRGHLLRAGVVMSAAVIATTLAQGAAQAAPHSLLVSLCRIGVSGVGTGTASGGVGSGATAGGGAPLAIGKFFAATAALMALVMGLAACILLGGNSQLQQLPMGYAEDVEEKATGFNSSAQLQIWEEHENLLPFSMGEPWGFWLIDRYPVVGVTPTFDGKPFVPEADAFWGVRIPQPLLPGPFALLTEELTRKDVKRLSVYWGYDYLILENPFVQPTVICETSEEHFAAIGKMKQLEYLALRDCQLTPDAFEQIGDLPNLKDLHITYQSPRIQGRPDLSGIERCNKLERLALYCSWVDETDVEAISGLKALKHLALPSFRLTSGAALAISKLESLEYLCVQGFEPDCDFSPLLNLKNLKGLNLLGMGEGEKPVSEDLRKICEALPLESLYIRGPFQGDLEILAACPKLKELGLAFAGAMPGDIATLSKLQGLEHLFILSSSINEEALSAICELKNLRYLGFSRVSFNVQPEAFEDLGNLSELRFIGADTNSPIFANLFDAVAQLPKLHSTAFYSIGTIPVTDEIIKSLARCRSLQNVMTDARYLSDEALGLFATMPNLKMLNLSSCLNLTDEGIRKLSASPSLTELVCIYALNLGPASAKYLASCKTLACVSLTTTGLTTADLEPLKANPAVRYVENFTFSGGDAEFERNVYPVVSDRTFPEFVKALEKHRASHDGAMPPTGQLPDGFPTVGRGYRYIQFTSDVGEKYLLLAIPCGLGIGKRAFALDEGGNIWSAQLTTEDELKKLGEITPGEVDFNSEDARIKQPVEFAFLKRIKE